MGQALYRKYRSKSLSEIVGQEHITSTLAKAIETGRLSHAYLFTGPRGTGKTSIARILAHAINELPYDDDSSHIDIIEIDAASNRRIDEIRDLREKVYVAPSSAKYKVYIIDEVHMLTREAFNALLKTLEEPPAHVIFILATTDAHKLPETIISRTQRYSFKPVEKPKVIDHLRHIAEGEGYTVDDEALSLIAEHGEGSFRDSISLLDQASSNGQAVTADTVRSLLGIPPHEQVEALADLALNPASAPQDIVTNLTELFAQGFEPAGIAKRLGEVLRSRVVNGAAGTGALQLIGDLLEVPGARSPERYLEITLLKALTLAESIPAAPVKPSAPQKAATESAPAVVTKPSAAAPPAKSSAATAQAESPAVEPIAEIEVSGHVVNLPEDKPKAKAKKAAEKPVASNDSTGEPVASADNESVVTGSVTIRPLDDITWQDILAALKKKYNTLYGLIRMAQPDFSGDTVKLTFAFAFHQKRLSDAKNQQRLAEVIKEVSGQNFKVECLVDKDMKAKPKNDGSDTQAPPAASDNTLSAISNIFGGGELLN